MMNEAVQQNISQLKEKISSFQKKRVSKKNKSLTPFYVLTMVFSDLISGVLVGTAIGYLLYRIFDLHVFVIAVFVLLGGFASILNLYRSVKVISKENQK
ncbi:MAG: hypothetical protein E7013_03885 [Alphaproteobacteria bacterium]|nr:hypothetical protein [Alphaproteobacteria bacterium]